MELIKFILPYYYTFKYNRKGFEGFAYFLEYTLLPFIIYWLYIPNITLLEIFIILTIVVTTYEIGYLYNNIISVQEEDHPTQRHSKEELKFGYDYFAKIIYIRFTFVMVLIIVLYLFESKYYIEITMGVLVITFVFYLYNIIRSGWLNRFLFFLLRFFRYYYILFFVGLPSVVVAFFISFVNLINNLSWYPKRTHISLPRFFGTKLFDSICFFFLFSLFFVFSHNLIAYVFLYLSFVKIILFIYKYIGSKFV